MITNAWIEKRKSLWERMAVLLDRAGSTGVSSLNHEELRELALLYRQIAGDLSALRQDRTAKNLQTQLNALLARGHSLVYSQQRKGVGLIWQFFRREYPALFRKTLSYTLASGFLFVLGGLLGATLTVMRPAFMTHLLGPQMLAELNKHEMWTLSINSMAPAASSGIMTNNLSVTFATYAMGITAGIGTLYMIGWNGILLGVVAAACAQHQMSIQLWSFVVPHGSLELPSIVLAGAAGLRLGAGLLFPGMYSRRYSIALAGAESGRLLAGIIPLLVIAGILEGFFSPSTTVPVPLKFVTGAVLFCALLAWLFSSAGESTAAQPVAVAQSKLASLTSR
ncbi:MAG TPA: stage II sporulation protein M [Acidobacteriaceae bacterium]|nr:stage II sporulation protein M [Acidobacteriaceae bacterium]